MPKYESKLTMNNSIPFLVLEQRLNSKIRKTFKEF